MTSAWSITAAVNPPRAAFVDYPLGHTTGQPHDPTGQRALLEAAFTAFEEATVAGTIVDLGLHWGDDAWRADPMRGDSRTAPKSKADRGAPRSDSRTERFDTPQYQSDEDRELAELRHGEEIACRACVGFDD